MSKNATRRTTTARTGGSVVASPLSPQLPAFIPLAFQGCKCSCKLAQHLVLTMRRPLHTAENTFEPAHHQANGEDIASPPSFSTMSPSGSSSCASSSPAHHGLPLDAMPGIVCLSPMAALGVAPTQTLEPTPSPMAAQSAPRHTVSASVGAPPRAPLDQGASAPLLLTATQSAPPSPPPPPPLRPLKSGTAPVRLPLPCWMLLTAHCLLSYLNSSVSTWSSHGRVPRWQT